MEVRLDGAEFLDQYGLQQGVFARKAAIQRLLAHSEVCGEIVHRDVAEAVRQEMAPGRGDDPSGDQRFTRTSMGGISSWHRKLGILIKYYQFPYGYATTPGRAGRQVGRMTAASNDRVSRDVALAKDRLTAYGV